MADIRRKQIEINDDLVDKIISILTRWLPKKVKICMNKLYNNWEEYISQFCSLGGVIEASPTCLSNQLGYPTISFFIEPSGKIKLIGSTDKF